MLRASSYMFRHQSATLKEFNYKLKTLRSLIFNFNDESEGD